MKKEIKAHEKNNMWKTVKVLAYKKLWAVNKYICIKKINKQVVAIHKERLKRDR